MANYEPSEGAPVVDREAYDAMVILPGVSDLPEDRYVNTFHFVQEAGGIGRTREQFADLITSVLGTFYQSNEQWLSSTALGTAPRTCEVRVYDPDQAAPREPDINTFVVSTAAHGLPNEVSQVISFYSERNIPRRRGRIYFGPLAVEAQELGAGAVGDRRPDPTFYTGLATAAAAIRDFADDEFVWCVKSVVAVDTYRPVTAGWVDNAFDTQRRRGLVASTRTVW